MPLRTLPYGRGGDDGGGGWWWRWFGSDNKEQTGREEEKKRRRATTRKGKRTIHQSHRFVFVRVFVFVHTYRVGVGGVS